MKYILERIQKTCNELKNYNYSQKISITNYKIHDGNFLGMNEISKVKDGWRDFKTGDLWGGKDKHAWFKTKVNVPKEFNDKVIALNFYTFEEGWDAVNPQFIIYVNGKQVQALDINHREVIISHKAKGGDIYNIDLHAYGGMIKDKKATLNGELVVIDSETRELYFNLQIPVLVCKNLDAQDKRRIDMLNVLNDAINIIDFRKIFSKEYYSSVHQANEYLKSEFYEKLCGDSDVIATCVGHTHIDVAWMWTVAQTREKSGRSFSTVLKLMEEYPEYIFMSSQPQLYKFVKEDYPEIYSKIKEKVKEGKWEPEGAMWLEADCNVTSGESLVRQILFGKRFFKKEFDVESEVLWLPDVFGYSAALPQILKKSDVNYFMTTKISWNQFNKMPYDTFMWQGIDGTEILTHFVTTKDLNDPLSEHFTTYNGNIHPEAIMGAWNRYQQKDINNDVLVCFGYGDGGGGATYEMLEAAKRLNKGIPGCPKVKMGTSKDYFKRVESKVKGNKRLPKWVGELYLEYHRGTYTSMARNKRDNRLSENIYLAAEKLNSMAAFLNKDYCSEELNKGWENILLNQFHDILPGSSIKEVYEVTKKEYKEIISSGNEILKSSAEFIASNIRLNEKSVVIFNSLSFIRSDICEFQIPLDIKNPAVVDENGHEIICQKVSSSEAIFFADSVPANGYKTYFVVESSKNDLLPQIFSSTRLAENKFFRIEFNENGEINSLYDKRNNREVIKMGSLGNQLQAFEDKPMNFDNWDIDIYYSEKMWKVNDVSRISIVENGPVRAALEIKRKFIDSTIVEKIYIYRDIARIDFDNYVDWKQSQVLLKAAFPIDINSSKATYEIQYGNVERPTHENTSWDMARFEVCGHKWADLSEGGFGVSLLNDSKYGYDIKDGIMRLTLIKSGIDPNPDADKEEHFFTYSLYPHNGDWREGSTVQMAYMLNNPLYSVLEEKHDGSLQRKLSFVKINKDNVIMEVMKKAEDSSDLIVRVYECYNKRSNVTMEFFKNIKSACECNLMERDLDEVYFKDNKINFTIKPYEIKSFKIKLDI